MPKVSVIIPTYNRAPVLPDALESLSKQSYQDFEVIVVDDGSTDNTHAVVETYCKKDSRIKYFYQENKERSAARNYGITLAQGEYIAFLDSDDIYLPSKIEKQVHLLDNHSEIGFVYCLASWMNQKGDRLEKKKSNTNYLFGDVYPNILFFNGSIITTPSVMLRKIVLKNTNGFDEKMSLCEDLDLWHRISKHTTFAQISEPLIVARAAEKKTPLWTIYKGRDYFYKKAFAKDSFLSHEFRAKLYAELYLFLGWKGLRSGNLFIFTFSFIKILFSGFLLKKAVIQEAKRKHKNKKDAK